MLVISCHADTGFQAHSLTHRADGIIQGHLDNFAGVQAVMPAVALATTAGVTAGVTRPAPAHLSFFVKRPYSSSSTKGTHLNSMSCTLLSIRR